MLIPMSVARAGTLPKPMLLLATAQALGEIYAWTGQRYTYYLRRRG